MNTTQLYEVIILHRTKRIDKPGRSSERAERSERASESWRLATQWTNNEYVGALDRWIRTTSRGAEGPPRRPSLLGFRVALIAI